MALFDLIAEKHRWTLANIGRWLLAFICSVLSASFLSSAILAASGSDSDLLPFDQERSACCAESSRPLIPNGDDHPT